VAPWFIDKLFAKYNRELGLAEVEEARQEETAREGKQA
jgi:hypothetical protein